MRTEEMRLLCWDGVASPIPVTSTHHLSNEEARQL